MVYAIHWRTETVDNKYSQSPKSYPRHSFKKPEMECRREIPKQNMCAHTNSFIWEWAELDCHSHKNARTKGPSPPSISRPTWPSSPTPLPPVPACPLFPKLPAGGHITHNGGDCPGGAHGPLRHGKGTHPKKCNAWQAFRAHTPPQMQCTFCESAEQCNAFFIKVQNNEKNNARCLLCSCIKTLAKCNNCM